MTERNYKGDTFYNQWQSYKENNNPKEDYEAKHKYVESREYQIRVKAVDLFENDTNNVVMVG